MHQKILMGRMIAKAHSLSYPKANAAMPKMSQSGLKPADCRYVDAIQEYCKDLFKVQDNATGIL